MSEETEIFLCENCSKETTHKLIKATKDSSVIERIEIKTDGEGCLISEDIIEEEQEFYRWFTFECSICGTSKSIDNEEF